MQQENRTRQSSLSESTCSSTNSSNSNNNIMKEFNLDDLTSLVGTSTQFLNRTGTVKRVLFKKVPNESYPKLIKSEKYRNSLDSMTKLNLESISEYSNRLQKSSYSNTRQTNSFDDYTFISPSRDTEVESVDDSIIKSSDVFNNFDNNIPTTLADIENKVGEWNNFWLNYSTSKNRQQFTNSYFNSYGDNDDDDDDDNDDDDDDDYDDDNDVDNLSDNKSRASIQKELNEKSSYEQIFLSFDEINEAIRCSQRITKILQNALKRSENEYEELKNESIYSQSLLKDTIVKDELLIPSTKCNYFHTINNNDLQKQKQLLKPTPQTSTNSCLNAILNSGVGDILKRVINKRRDVITTGDMSSQNTYSEWSTTK